MGTIQKGQDNAKNTWLVHVSKSAAEVMFINARILPNKSKASRVL